MEQRTLSQLTEDEVAHRESARSELRYQPVTLTGQQALSIAVGFAKKASRSGYLIWACAILPEHTHLVIGRHQYQVEQIANLLKGAATKQLVEDGIHPLKVRASSHRRPPSTWARRQWKSYLDSDEAIENAIAYVNDNPVKEGKPPQSWSWIQPYSGLDSGSITHW